jgi:hypothetical protein
LSTVFSKARFQKSISFSENNCLTADQVADLAALFDNDKDRLEFCKRAFENTVDKQNYYEVYNSFFYFSNVFRLHDFLKEEPESAPALASKKSGKVETSPKEDVMSSFSQPDPDYYFGPTGCNTPVSDGEFETLLEQLGSVEEELDRLTKAKNISAEHCLATSQSMRLSVALETEDARLEYLKFAAAKVYDLHNFGYSLQVLNFTASKNELAAVLGEKGQLASAIDSEIPINGPCLVSDAEFREMETDLKSQNFNSSKLAMAKQMIQSNCLNAEQITDLIKIFEFETTKLEVAKYAFDYVEDPENYYKVNEAFGYSTSATKLNDYIQSK